MPALRWKSRIGDHRAVVSIQRRGLVRDGLWWKKARRRRRRQSRQARHGNKRSREQRERFGEHRIGEQGSSFQRYEREQREEAREEEVAVLNEVLPLEFESFQVAPKCSAEFRILQSDFNGCF